LELTCKAFFELLNDNDKRKRANMLSRRWWAGYVLDNESPSTILPPKGSDINTADWYLPIDQYVSPA
jgi:hypothetical protein